MNLDSMKTSILQAIKYSFCELPKISGFYELYQKIVGLDPKTLILEQGHAIELHPKAHEKPQKFLELRNSWSYFYSFHETPVVGPSDENWDSSRF